MTLVRIGELAAAVLDELLCRHDEEREGLRLYAPDDCYEDEGSEEVDDA